MSRTRKLEQDAEQVAIYLTPMERLVMDVIVGRRKKRQEDRTSPSQVVADALWTLLDGEGIPRKKIQELLDVQVEDSKDKDSDKLKAFPKRS